MRFSGPRLKIIRAKQHIADFHARMVAFSKTDYYRLYVDKDSQTGNNAIKFEIVKPIPEDTALIIGDAIHNLKGALDFAINDIVFEKLGERPRFTRFPVRGSREELINAMNGGTIRKASVAISDLIVDVIKPYKGGNDSIYALHDMNVIDKHQLLLPVVHVSSLVGVDAEDENQNRIIGGTFVVSEGKVNIPLVSSSNFKITNHGKAAFQVFFGKGTPIEGKPVIYTLQDFTQAVTAIMDAFDICLS